MKLMLGNTPVKKMMIHNDTQDATAVASDLQAGVTCYAKGQKVTGTGKCFSFAWYGMMETNDSWYIPSDINIIEVASTLYPVRLNIELSSLKNTDFSRATVATINIDNVEYNIDVVVLDNELTLECEQTVRLQVFYGKDEYV